MSKLQLSPNKVACLQKLSDENGIISALAFDQRGALKRLMAQYQTEEPTVAQMEELKVLVADELTKYASSMLLDPEYGLPATKALDPNAGLLLAYEKTGYDTTSTKRLPDCLDVWSAKRIKEQGADAVKFLLYYDVDSSDELNQEKQAYIERIGSSVNKPTSNASVQSVWRKTFHSSLKSSLTMKKSLTLALLNTQK
ncbi:deoxyribose-phosphate aldolase domain protein [Streptococcus sp. SR1]|nr:deoxyribose-phosphate aldolase domain protein [Streptococcus sp. SR1]